MVLRRFLRYLNFAIAAALVVLLIAAYRYAWRPLPQTSGTIDAPVSGRAVVLHDSLGVPHILAAHLPDALFLQGYVTAQDRLFQMDALRRAAAGELAEAIGPAALDLDREARRMRMRRIAEQYYAGLPAEDRAVLAAFARGVNFFLLTHRNRLPLEFTLLGYEPRPWSIIDSLMVSLHMMNTMDRSWRGDIEKASLLQGGDPARLNFLFPSRTGAEARPGSNAWAISGAHTISRGPILAGDPHLEFSLPCPWYMIHLAGPRLNVSGVSLPGLPGVLVGHNDRIAWSITSLQFDVQDLYLEQLNPASGQYVFRGKSEQAAPEREIIRVKGQAPENLALWVTRHGPVFLADGGRLFSLRWTAADAAGLHYPLLELDRARDWTQFRSALARFPGPALTFVYSDISGNIGSQIAGRLPIRKNFDGSVPLDGASGQFEWDGLIPFDKLPSTFNPPSGMVVSANEDPFPKDFGYTVSGDFTPPYRSDRIRSRLAAKKVWRPDDMLAIQTDVYSAYAHFLARELVAAYDRHAAANSGLAIAVDLLRKWDGRMLSGEAAPLIVTLAGQHIRRAVADRASPGKGPNYGPRIAPAAVERLLREKPKDWFQDFDQLILTNFREAVEEGRRMQGRDVAKWDYGRYNSLFLRNLVAGSLPVVGKYFNIGPVRMSGSPETVAQMFRGERIIGPSMRMVVDLSNFEASRLNITLGESGQVFSGHYKDQWDAYLEGRSFPMQFWKTAAKGTLTFLPEKR